MTPDKRPEVTPERGRHRPTDKPAEVAPPPAPPLRAGAVLPALALLTVFLAGFHSLIDADVWFHLRAGSEVARGAIPRVDTFSYPSAGRPYIDLHWLFQLCAWVVHRLAGEPGLIWFACLVATAAFFLVYKLAAREAPAPLAGALVALGAVVASERLSPRPEVFSFLCLALVGWSLRRHAEGSRRAWWIIPVVMLFWVNSEGLFVLGYLLVGAAILDRPRDRRLWQSLGLSLAASLVNPYFVQGALHPLVLFTRVNRSLPIYSATIGEFLSPFAGSALHPAVAVFPFCLGLLGASLLALILLGGARRLRRSEVVLVAAFVYLSCSARRNLALLPIVTVPILARWLAAAARQPRLARFWSRRTAGEKRTAAFVAVAASVLALLAYDAGLVTNRLYIAAETNRRFGTGQAEADFARGAARFLNEQKIEGPIFTSFAAGSFLSFAYPREREFIDGRLEVHTAAHYERYLRMLQGGPLWAEADRQYGFNAAVIQYMDAMPLVLERLKDPAWALVHLDDTSVVLLRRNEKNEPVIDRNSVTPATLHADYPSLTAAEVDSSFAFAPPDRSPLRFLRRERFPWSRMQLGQFFFTINRMDLALPQFLAAVQQAPDQVAPRLSLASTLNQMSRPQLAFQVLQSAERLGGNREMRLRAAATRGDVLVALGRAAEAVAAYTDYLRAPSSPAQVPTVLASRGLARLRAGDPESAAADLTESVRRQPNNAQAWWYLGMVEEARRNPDAARRAYQAFLNLGGRSSEVEAALKRLGGS